MRRALERNKTLLVLGGTGFFGKSILDSFKRGLLEQYQVGEIIIVARNISKFQIEYSDLITSNVHLVQGDIGTLNSIPFADIVIHAASSTNKLDYIKNSRGQKINIERATENYCQLASRLHGRSKIVYCSSGAVYGQQPPDLDRITENFPFQDVEDLPLAKRDYALGKRNSEKSIVKLGKEQGLSVSIARCFAFYGKHLPTDQHFAYGNFIGQAKIGRDIVVQAKNPVYRSYMAADDLVNALLIIALHSNDTCPIFNVGSNKAILIHDLAKKIGKEYGVSCELNEITESNNVDRYVPDTTKLEYIINSYNDRFNVK